MRSIFRRPQSLLAALLLGGLATGSPVPAQAAEVIDGTWLTPGGRARVEFAACGDKLCGSIVWLKEPNDEKGKPLRDHYNKDESLQRRPILGLPVLTALTADGSGRWLGWVYDPERGQSFEATVVEAGGEQLEITGCGLMGLVCKTQVWTRTEPVTAQSE